MTGKLCVFQVLLSFKFHQDLDMHHLSPWAIFTMRGSVEVVIWKWALVAGHIVPFPKQIPSATWSKSTQE